MKLILSSCDFRSESAAKAIYDNLDMPASSCRILFFPNEKATESRIRDGFYETRLEEFGFRHPNISVFNYYDPAPFFDRPYDAVYVSGGNTFSTIKRIRNAGADRLIRDLVAGGALYIGGCAGAHIVSADIAHVAAYDRNIDGVTDFSGIGLYPGILLCHYSDTRKAHYESLCRESPYPVTALRDDEYILIETDPPTAVLHTPPNTEVFW